MNVTRRKPISVPKLPDPDVPLRLSVAAAVAFPDGSMVPSSLRREANRGRLVIERVAGKDFATLANIERRARASQVRGRPGSP